MSSASRGFNKHRLLGYAESHDEERLMYKNLQFGNSSNSAHNVKNLNTALSRMSAIGAVSLLVPGPKMIWHFGELGWEQSIFTCNNGTVNLPGGTDGDCKLDTKPQPQWTGNWFGDNNRNKIYYDWAKMNALKVNEPVFVGNVTIAPGNTDTPNIKINNPSLGSNELRDVLIIANFGVVAKNVATGFPYTGQWYDLMDLTEITVTDVNQTISLQPGQFKILGNKQANLAVEDFEKEATLKLYPNPASNYFTLSAETTQVEIYSITGQRVKVIKGNSTPDQTYNISDLTKGFYLVKATNAAKETQVLKFIKN